MITVTVLTVCLAHMYYIYRSLDFTYRYISNGRCELVE